jgi:hypothetical protein
MSTEINVFDGDVTIDTARIEVTAIGSGCIVTATLVDQDGTAVIAASTVLPEWAFDMELASKAGSQLLTDLRSRLDATVTTADALL